MDAVANAGGPFWAEDWMRIAWRYVVAPMLLVVLVLALYVLAYRQGAADCQAESAIAFQAMRSARYAVAEAHDAMAMTARVVQQTIGPDSPCLERTVRDAW